jgi:hypothetical protein
MNHFLSPEIWVSSLIGALIALLLKVAYQQASKWLPRFLSSATGSLKGIGRAYRKRHLLKVKAKRFDSIAINREIARSYAYLVLFWLCGLIWISQFIAFTEAPTSKAVGASAYYALFGPLPMYFFEFAWLRKSGFLDSVLVHRGKIRRCGMRLY